MVPRVLITGASGRIGSFLARHLSDRYDLVLTDLRPPDAMPGLPFTRADITDLAMMRQVCKGAHTVLHLAADPDTQATWESLLPNNIVGVQSVFQAAFEAGCQRVIFASSVNAVIGYPRDVQVHTNMPVRPGNLYGATKAWGEAVACFYADQLKISAICLRLGWVVSRRSSELAQHHDMLDIALTQEDLARLVTASINAPASVRFGIFHGLSNNRFKRLDISDTRAVLGYAPEDDAFALAGVAG